MNAIIFALALAALAGSSVNAVHNTVASCAELASINSATTSITITSSPLACTNYTRILVSNDMVLSATVPNVLFSNVAFEVSGELTLEPSVEFTGITDEEVYGGALYVDEGATTRFMGTSAFTENSIMATALPSTSCGENCFISNSVRYNGGAIHNKGILIFEGDSQFTANEARTPDSTDLTRGGAIYNTVTGFIFFKANLAMDDNVAEGFFSGQGGAIGNGGDIVVDGDSSFSRNNAANGGAINQNSNGTVTFNGFATFSENKCYEYTGAAIANTGSVHFLGGSLFTNNFADSSGDGGDGAGIYNVETGSVTFGGDNSTFKENWANRGGAIFNGVLASITRPQDGGNLVFLNNGANVCPDIYNDQPGSADAICSA